jgi:hypothetical protein
LLTALAEPPYGLGLVGTEPALADGCLGCLAVYDRDAGLAPGLGEPQETACSALSNRAVV